MKSKLTFFPIQLILKRHKIITIILFALSS